MRHDRGDILAGRLGDLRWEVLIIFQPRRESGCIRFDKFVVWILFDILLLYLVGNTIKTVLIKFPKFRDRKRF